MSGTQETLIFVAAALKKINNLEGLGFNDGLVSGAIVRMKQIKDEAAN